MRGRLTAPMMDMILAAITRMTRAMALAARTDAFTVLFAPRTAFTGARRCRQMNLADELTPLTPLRLALNVRSRVVLPALDAISSSPAVRRALASPTQPRPVEPRALALPAALPTPLPICRPMLRLALPLAAYPAIRSDGFTSLTSMGPPAFLPEAVLPRRAAFPAFLACLRPVLYAVTISRLPRVMRRLAPAATPPTPCLAAFVPDTMARAASSVAVWPAVSAMSDRSAPPFHAFDTAPAAVWESRCTPGWRARVPDIEPTSCHRSWWNIGCTGVRRTGSAHRTAHRRCRSSSAPGRASRR